MRDQPDTTDMAALGRTALEDISAADLSNRSEEELAYLWRIAENMEMAALGVRGAVAHELRRRYRNAQGWYRHAAEVLGASLGSVYDAANLWEAFNHRPEHLRKFGTGLALACLKARDPESAIDYALTELAQGRTRRAIENDVRRKFMIKPSRRFILGPPLSFRHLQHAPSGEQGVVFLFGMIASELGFLVEGVREDFPDCQAKREVAPGKYASVTIEFEYKSSNFKRHGHASEVDLIVCWEHDWPDCPSEIEVIELSRKIRELGQHQRVDGR